MVKAFCPDRSDVTQTTLDLVGNGKRSQKVLAGLSGILRCRQDRSHVIARMAGFGFCQIAVVKIKIAHQGTVIEGSSVRGCSSTSNQSTVRISAEIFDMFSQNLYRHCLYGPNGASQTVEHSQSELLSGILGKILVIRP